MADFIIHLLSVALILQVGWCCTPKRLSIEDQRQLKKYDIVPNITEKAPLAPAVIKYGDTTYKTLGNMITITQAHNKPQVSWPSLDGTYYTLIMMGPGSPDLGIETFVHWVVVNILSNNIKYGNTLMEYLGPATPEQLGYQSYILLVFEQDKIFEKDDLEGIVDNLKTRATFNVKKLTKMLDLTGNPIAGNFFRMKADKNVKKYTEDIKKHFE